MNANGYLKKSRELMTLAEASAKRRPRTEEMPPKGIFLSKPYLPRDILQVVSTFS